MYAVIRTGGKQYKVTEGDQIVVEKLDAETGNDVTFSDVLMLDDGNKLLIGEPLIEGACVFGEVVEQRRGKKIVIFKKRQRSTYRRKQGHRQYETVVNITGVSADGSRPIVDSISDNYEVVEDMSENDTDISIDEAVNDIPQENDSIEAANLDAEKIEDSKEASESLITEVPEATDDATAFEVKESTPTAENTEADDQETVEKTAESSDSEAESKSATTNDTSEATVTNEKTKTPKA